MAKKPLAEFELLVMLAVARLDDAYGASIRRELEERSGRDVSIGALYATLARLEDKGLLGAEVTDPLPVPGGRSRKVYDLRPEGLAAVRSAVGMIDRLRDGLDLSRSESGS